MVYLKFYLILTAFFIWHKYEKKYDIVVVGTAVNRKEGASVISRSNKKYYFLDGIDSWDQKTKGNMIKVSGTLLIEEIKKLPQEPGYPIPQQMVGIKRTIINAKWKLIK